MTTFKNYHIGVNIDFLDQYFIILDDTFIKHIESPVLTLSLANDVSILENNIINLITDISVI